MNSLKRLRMDHWAWVQAKVMLLAWGCIYLFFPPVRTYEELGKPLVYIAASFVVIGSIISIIGLVISTNESPKHRHSGLAIEACGLIFATCGPLSFFTVQVVRVGSGELYVTRAVFSYVMASLLMARTAQVIRALHRGRHNVRP